MRIELTKKQLQQLQENHAVDVSDPKGLQSYVVLRKEIFEQVRELIEDWDPRTMKRHLAKIMADDWTGPEMDVYDQKEYDHP